MKRLYEILWRVETDVVTLLYREFGAFHSEAEARQYGKKRERELNNGEPIEQQALEGYYFKYLGVCEVQEIDGLKVQLICPQNS